MDTSWYTRERTALKSRLQGNLTLLARLAGISVTTLSHAFLRLAPLSPRAARRLALAYNSLRLPGTLYWQDLLDPVSSVHHAFAPLHPDAVRLERERDMAATRNMREHLA